MQTTPTALYQEVELIPGEDEYVIFGNQRNPVKIIATKIVCTDESELPNWGESGDDINENTASNWVNDPDHSSCSLVKDWYFQWGDDKDANPGDTLIGEDSNWTTFGPTDTNGHSMAIIYDLEDTAHIKVREVLQDGYIFFTYGTNNDNSDDVSAEIYCHKAVSYTHLRAHET